MSQLQQPEPMLSQRTGTIMIVDDEMMVTSSLQTMLGLETQHRIHCFNNPLEALAQVAQLQPDVVISDFSMPGMDGITLLRNIKQQLPEATLILLTGYADKENAIEAINSVGIYRYIEKPWDNEDLKINIQNGLERSHLVGDLKQSVQELTEARAQLQRHNQHLEALVSERTQDLQATYQKLQSIVTNTADGIITLDAELRVASLNPAAEAWLRAVPALNSTPLQQAPITDLLKPVPESGKAKSIRNLFNPSSPRQVGEVLIGELPLEASVAPLIPLNPEADSPPHAESDATTGEGRLSLEKATNLEPAGFVMVLRDIAQRKEIERLRDDFVSTLTHDLRTPLLAAIQTLGFFADGTLGELSPRQHELISMLIQSNRELLGLVNVLLEVYKYESGRQKLIFDQVNLAELIDGIVQELNALANTREQQLSLALNSECPPAESSAFQLRGDKQELKRVFVNLIGNAINFTPKGGQIHVSLTLQSAPKPVIQVCVCDNGRGIPAQDIPLLFQRFSQGTSKQRSSGSGLGLYLSRQIVEAHQGQIWVESQEGQGSRFFVILPQQAQATP